MRYVGKASEYFGTDKKSKMKKRAMVKQNAKSSYGTDRAKASALDTHLARMAEKCGRIAKTQAYGTSEGVKKAWDTRGRGLSLERQLSHSKLAKWGKSEKMSLRRKERADWLRYKKRTNHEEYRNERSRLIGPYLKTQTKPDRVSRRDSSHSWNSKVRISRSEKREAGFGRSKEANKIRRLRQDKSPEGRARYAKVRREHVTFMNKYRARGSAIQTKVPVSVHKARASAMDAHLAKMAAKKRTLGVDVAGSGTSEGVKKAWDTRGRGRKRDTPQNRADRAYKLRWLKKHDPAEYKKHVKNSPYNLSNIKEHRQALLKQSRLLHKKGTPDQRKALAKTLREWKSKGSRFERSKYEAQREFNYSHLKRRVGAAGTSEGVRKAWDTRGRGRKRARPGTPEGRSERAKMLRDMRKNSRAGYQNQRRQILKRYEYARNATEHLHN